MKRYDRTRALVEGDPSLAREMVRSFEEECAAFDDEGDVRGIVVLDEPHEELVMMQARETAQGGLFYLGEALASSCRVSFDGAVGYGFVLGSHRCRAYELAVIDAAFSGVRGEERMRVWEDRLQEQLRAVRAEESSRAACVSATKVDFATMDTEA